MSDCSVRVIDSLAEWEGLSGTWNALLQKSSARTVFLTWEWLSSWASCYLDPGRKLFLLAVYRQNALIGIAPWYVQTVRQGVFHSRQIRFLGTPESGSDYLDVIALEGKEREVAAALFAFLLNEARFLWDSLLLRDIPADSLFYLHFSSRIEGSGKYSEISNGSFCPVASVANDLPEAPVSARRKQKYDRDMSVLKRSAVISHRTYAHKSAAEGINLFFSFAQGRSGYAPSLRGLLTAFSAKCRDTSVQADILSADEKVIAGIVHLRYGFEQYVYLLATDKQYNPKISVGNVLVGLCITKAVQQGIRQYDFLKGAEPYKFHWANAGRRSLNLYFPQKRVATMPHLLSRMLKDFGRVLLR
jgi:hypothetical protein